MELTADKARQWSEAKPYPHLIVNGFIDVGSIVHILKDLSQCDFMLKESDLFTFLQTYDLNDSTLAAIEATKKRLTSPETIAALEAITGQHVAARIDLHATIYQDTHHLLCHDDDIQNRALAFILYLSDMTPTSGGALQLFAKGKDEPVTVTKTIIPKAGTLVILGVGDGSWHGVSEVVEDRQRVALAGWYHAK